MRAVHGKATMQPTHCQYPQTLYETESSMIARASTIEIIPRQISEIGKKAAEMTHERNAVAQKIVKPAQIIKTIEHSITDNPNLSPIQLEIATQISFLALAAHNIPIHPNILQDFPGPACGSILNHPAKIIFAATPINNIITPKNNPFPKQYLQGAQNKTAIPLGIERTIMPIILKNR